MADIRQFTPESLRKIQEDHTRLKALASNVQRAAQAVPYADGEVIRTVTGFTSTNTSYPTYPTASGHNTYVVKLRDYYFTEATGVQTRTAAGSFTQSILARTWDGSSVAEDTPVMCDLVHCIGRGHRWWIRPIPTAGTTPLRWTQMVSASGQSTWYWWQYGAGARDTDGTIEITTDGVYAFPRFGLGTYYNSVGTAFALTTSPTAYNDKCITFSQKAWYSLSVTLTWGLPPLTSSQFNSGYRDSADHNHAYTDNGVGMTTGDATIYYPSRDTRQAVTVVTEINGVECGRSSIQNFYTADQDPDRFISHSRYLQIDRSSSLTGLDIRFRRLVFSPSGTYYSATPYVINASVRLEQISDNL